MIAAILLAGGLTAQAVDIEQLGEQGVIGVLQAGRGGHAASVFQDGLRNTIDVEQIGGAAGNFAVIAQDGADNLIRLKQEGSDNVAHLSQHGEGNRMEAIQYGEGNRLTWSQSGVGLSSPGAAPVVIMPGGMTLSITQSAAW